MKNTFNLYYWIAQFNNCESETQYKKVSEDFDKMLSKLPLEEQQKTKQEFKAYTLKRLERLEQQVNIVGERIEEHQLIQAALEEKT